MASSDIANILRIIQLIVFANAANAFAVNSGAYVRAPQTSRLCAPRFQTSTCVAGLIETANHHSTRSVSVETNCKPSRFDPSRKYRKCGLFLQNPELGNAESVVAEVCWKMHDNSRKLQLALTSFMEQVELKHALNAEEGSLSERLRKTLK